MGIGATPSFFGMFKNLSAYGSIASAPPLPAPGRSVLDTFGFLQVYRSPLDLLFFHSWPDEINEGLTTTWEGLPFTGASAPLAFVYRGNQWDDYQVKLQIHTSNPVQPLKFSGPIDSVGGTANAILDILRVQLQVAWCKSVCLPNTDKINKVAKGAIKNLLNAQKFTDVVKAFADVASKSAGVAKEFAGGFLDNSIYAGDLFPPLIACQYGGFLRMYGFCSSCQIRWLPPFVPLTAHPHRAEVTMNFKRFFPFNLPTRNQARIKLGYMM